MIVFSIEIVSGPLLPWKHRITEIGSSIDCETINAQTQNTKLSGFSDVLQWFASMQLIILEPAPLWHCELCALNNHIYRIPPVQRKQIQMTMINTKLTLTHTKIIVARKEASLPSCSAHSPICFFSQVSFPFERQTLLEFHAPHVIFALMIKIDGSTGMDMHFTYRWWNECFANKCYNEHL